MKYILVFQAADRPEDDRQKRLPAFLSGRDSRIYKIPPCISPYGPARKPPLKKAPAFFHEPTRAI